MVYAVETDLIPLIRQLLTAMQPFARANEVDLSFTPAKETLPLTCAPGDLLSDLSLLVSNIISFTPQDYAVEIHLEESAQEVFVLVHNSGADLSGTHSILNGLKKQVEVISDRPDSSCFRYRISSEPDDPLLQLEDTQLSSETYHIPPFYHRFQKDLQTHFKSLSSLEKQAASRSPREGIFLKKVNAVIQAHLGEEGFSVEHLSRSMALSRTQLFRRLKPLVGMSPGRYIRYVRLQKAKKLLEREDVNIGEAAFRTGFVNQSHFARSFREQFGFNPSEIIKQEP